MQCFTLGPSALSASCHVASQRTLPDIGPCTPHKLYLMCICYTLYYPTQTACPRRYMMPYIPFIRSMSDVHMYPVWSICYRSLCATRALSTSPAGSIISGRRALCYLLPEPQPARQVRIRGIQKRNIAL